MAKKPFLEAGKVVGTHGVRGEMRVECWCDSPAVFAKLKTIYLDEAGKQSAKSAARPHKSMVLLKMDGVDTVEQAETYRGRVLYLSRRDVKLPKGQYFISDLIGLTVKDAATGAVYGTLTEVSATGANDVYHIRTPRGEVLIPAVASLVIEVDPEAGFMKIRPLRGMFDDAD